jgi:hypothetical protein
LVKQVCLYIRRRHGSRNCRGVDGGFAADRMASFEGNYSGTRRLFGAPPKPIIASLLLFPE